MRASLCTGVGFRCLLGLAVSSLLAILLFVLPARQPVTAQTSFPTAVPNDAAFSPPLPAGMRFEHLTSEDGLSQNSVFFIFQDRQGFLWIGTQDGLNRYDGEHFVVFRSDPADENSLSHNAVLCAAEDAEGSLWLGTWGGGLNRYDPREGVFTRYQHDPTDPYSLSNDVVSALAFDSAGRLWIGTMGDGLDLFDRQSGHFTHYRANADDPYALSSNHISAVQPDPSGGLWIGTGGYGREGNGLNFFDPQTGKAIAYRFAPNNPNTLTSNTISSLALDRSGVLWVGTGGYMLQGRGLNRLDTRTGWITRYQHDVYDMYGLSSNDIISLFLDNSGTLWIGTWGSGVDRLDTHEAVPKFLHYRNDPYDPYSLNGNTIWSIYQDRGGVLWFGSTQAGLNKINPLAQRFHLYRNNPGKPKSLAGNAVGPMIEDEQGSVWIGTVGYGLERFDRPSGVFQHYSARPDSPLYQEANTYLALLEDNQGEIWAGTMAGLLHFDRRLGRFTPFRSNANFPQSLPTEKVSALALDERQRLWVAHQNGLDWFDREQKRFTHMEIPEAGAGTDLYADGAGVLWLGTQDSGLFRLDLASASESPPRYTRYQHDDSANSLADNNIVDIFGDSEGMLWLATSRGLDRLDPRQGIFTHYSVEDGLTSNRVLCILEDDQKRLWISTNEGISRFDRDKNLFRTYDALDGLQGNEFSGGSCMRTQAGELYFGGVSGLSVFNPREIQDNPYPPRVALTNFFIYNQPAPVDWLSGQPVRLAYQQDFIAFEFAVLDFHVPQKNRLFYRLEGFDKDWIQAANGGYTSYTNLPGGSYIFRARGANNDGVWSENELAIPIEVARPLWEMVWFQAGGVLLLALIAFAGVRAYLINIQVQNRRLEELVEQRTQVLRQTNERLRQEMAQRQKAEEALAQKAAEEAVAAERSRLARDLHDAVTQTLFSASLTADVLPDLWQMDPAEARRSTEDLRQLTRGALAEMRTLLIELRPSALIKARFDDLLRQLVEGALGRARVPVELTITGQRALAPDVQVALYRMAQEALHNIVKYARASQVCIELHMSEAGVLLAIRDDGIGFDPAAVRPTSMGLRIMRERADSSGIHLTVKSAPGQGTLVEMDWMDPNVKELE